jgi:hypothetical protein
MLSRKEMVQRGCQNIITDAVKRAQGDKETGSLRLLGSGLVDNFTVAGVDSYRRRMAVTHHRLASVSHAAWNSPGGACQSQPGVVDLKQARAGDVPVPWPERSTSCRHC